MAFNQVNNWGEQGGGDGRAAVAVVSGGRMGIFGARCYTTHQHTLQENIGIAPKGRKVLLSVQSYHAASAETQAAAKWVCAHPECRGKSWASKEALFVEHGEPDAIVRKREAHCVMAISWLPAEEDVITGVMMPARQQNATTRITTKNPHGLNLGDAVVIMNVMGRHDAMANANQASDMLSRVNAAKAYQEMGNKKKAQEILDAIDFGVEKTSTLAPLSVNGQFLAMPFSADTFDIAQELNGVFVASEDPKLQPRVILKPRRPVLLSDVE